MAGKLNIIIGEKERLSAAKLEQRILEALPQEHLITEGTRASLKRALQGIVLRMKHETNMFGVHSDESMYRNNDFSREDMQAVCAHVESLIEGKFVMTGRTIEEMSIDVLTQKIAV